MADVTIDFAGRTIAEMDGAGNKTLHTGGRYCEGDIVVKHTPNSRSYAITLDDPSTGWVSLTDLDADVLEHINDPTMTAMLINIDPYEYELGSRRFLFASNTQLLLYSNKYPVYGCAGFATSETSATFQSVYYKPNKTDTSLGIGGVGAFRVTDGKYYATGIDRPFKAGNYRLTFTW